MGSETKRHSLVVGFLRKHIYTAALLGKPDTHVFFRLLFLARFLKVKSTRSHIPKHKRVQSQHT